ncbi:hypothetical protein [Aeromonas sp. 1HA1]|nr:hypothetical protein [Aeromonas sp. 1HA1]
MTTNEKVARRKLSLLELAKELNNVSYGDFWCMGEIEKVAYPAD